METLTNRIEAKLQASLAPIHLEVTDESFMHASGPDAESHCSIIAVSDQFETLSLVQRHRAVNSVLKDEFEQGLHALVIQAFSPTEWEARQAPLRTSPPCLGGSGEPE